MGGGSKKGRDACWPSMPKGKCCYHRIGCWDRNKILMRRGGRLEQRVIEHLVMPAVESACVSRIAVG